MEKLGRGEFMALNGKPPYVFWGLVLSCKPAYLKSCFFAKASIKHSDG
jgi:hypothetical protein